MSDIRTARVDQPVHVTAEPAPSDGRVLRLSGLLAFVAAVALVIPAMEHNATERYAAEQLERDRMSWQAVVTHAGAADGTAGLDDVRDAMIALGYTQPGLADVGVWAGPWVHDAAGRPEDGLDAGEWTLVDTNQGRLLIAVVPTSRASSGLVSVPVD